MPPLNQITILRRHFYNPQRKLSIPAVYHLVRTTILNNDTFFFKYWETKRFKIGEERRRKGTITSLSVLIKPSFLLNETNTDQHPREHQNNTVIQNMFIHSKYSIKRVICHKGSFLFFQQMVCIPIILSQKQSPPPPSSTNITIYSLKKKRNHSPFYIIKLLDTLFF